MSRRSRLEDPRLTPGILCLAFCLLQAETLLVSGHSAAAQQAYENFRARSQRREVPDNVPKRTVTIDGETIGIAALLKQCGLVESTSAAFRLMQQGGVRLNDEKITDTKASVKAGGTYLFQVGKRVFEEITVDRQ